MTIVRIFCNGPANYVIRNVNSGTEYPGFESYEAAEQFALRYGWSIAR